MKLKDFIHYGSYDKYGRQIIDFLKQWDVDRDHLKDITLKQDHDSWIIYRNNKKLTTVPLDRIPIKTIDTYGLAH
jgi:hypothetical protein